MKRINLLHNIMMGLTNIGRYKVLHELGHGAMGVVYKGNDTIIDRIVALKTVKLGKALSPIKEKELIDLFYREVRIAGKLSHPNIATIYDAGEYYDIHYFVMEYVEGISIKQIIQEEMAISLVDKVKILTLIANALHYAHQRGVIHRDIKPANIMLLADLQIKIMDFGIAMLSSASDTVSKSMGDRIMGTPSYMSPEQIGNQELDRQTDLFSLGGLAYEFLTGRKAFQGRDLTELFTRIRSENPPPPHLVNPAIPKSLSACILKALEKDKEKRYQSANEIADDLEIFVNSAAAGGGFDDDTSRLTANKEFLIALKKRYTFFSDFTFDELHKIFKISSRLVYKAAEVIFKEDTVGKTMYIILSGRVKITKLFKNSDKPLVLNILKTGDCFGEMAFMESGPRFATATVEIDSTLLAINEVILRNSEPRICLKLYKNLILILSEKLRKSDSKVNALMAKQKKQALLPEQESRQPETQQQETLEEGIKDRK